MKRLLLGAVFALAPAAALAADLSGDWTLNCAFDSMGVKYTTTCTLAEDSAGKLAGPCLGNANEKVAASGAVTTGSDGKVSVEFGYDTTYQGTPVHLDYKGAPQPDGSLVGTIETGGPQGAFTATRK